MKRKQYRQGSFVSLVWFLWKEHRGMKKRKATASYTVMVGLSIPPNSKE